MTPSEESSMWMRRASRGRLLRPLSCIEVEGMEGCATGTDAGIDWEGAAG